MDNLLIQLTLATVIALILVMIFSRDTYGHEQGIIILRLLASEPEGLSTYQLYKRATAQPQTQIGHFSLFVILDKLQNDGLVVRFSQQQDQRYIYRLTEKGKLSIKADENWAS